MSNELLPINKCAKVADIPVSRAALARLARLGQIPVTRIGTRWFARPDELRAAMVCARRIIKECNGAKATVKKLVDRRIDGIPGPPWPTDVVADFKRLRAAMQAVIDMPPVRCGEYSYLPFVNGQNQQQVRIQEELRKALG